MPCPGSNQCRCLGTTLCPNPVSLSSVSTDSGACRPCGPMLFVASPTTTCSRPTPSSKHSKLGRWDRAVRIEAVAAGVRSASWQPPSHGAAACTAAGSSAPCAADCLCSDRDVRQPLSKSTAPAAALLLPAHASPPRPCPSTPAGAWDHPSPPAPLRPLPICPCSRSPGAMPHTESERWVRCGRPAAMSRTEDRKARPAPRESERWVMPCRVRRRRQSSAYCVWKGVCGTLGGGARVSWWWYETSVHVRLCLWLCLWLCCSGVVLGHPGRGECGASQAAGPQVLVCSRAERRKRIDRLCAGRGMALGCHVVPGGWPGSGVSQWPTPQACAERMPTAI